MPTLAQVRQFLSLTVVPVLAGSAATWLCVHLHFLADFHLTSASVAGELTQLGVWGVSAGLTFLAGHNILKDVYGGRAKPAVAVDGTCTRCDRKVA